MGGFGFNVQMLSGNKSTVEAVQGAIGRKILSMKLDPEQGDGGQLQILLDTNMTLKLQDAARSCCESRYMITDDNLDELVGATLTGLEIVDSRETEKESGDVVETQFLKVITDKGTATIANYNSHNGYYGGISLTAVLE